MDGGRPMILFLSGFAAGVLLMAYMLRRPRWPLPDEKDSVAIQAERWKYQRPLPPF
jgi:hypothetical protein